VQIILHPKKQFQAFHGEAREAWSRTATDRSTQLAFCYAISEMAALGFSKEQIAGANTFSHIVLNIGEPEPPSPAERYPAVPLTEQPTSEQLTET